MQLEAITEHNAKLPPRKKAKETLPEIVASNVFAKTIKEKEEKLKGPDKGKITYNLTKKYYNIGFVDGSQKTRGVEHVAPQPRGSSAYTLNNRTKALQKMSSKARIASLRNHFGGLINAKDNKEEEVQNPFQASQ